MRLFVAIDLDETARHAIGEEQQRIRAAVGGRKPSALKWVQPDHMHLTLAFLGEIEEAGAPAIIAAVAPDLDVPRFTFAFEGLGVFPPRGAPRVLWTGVAAGSREVIAVQHQVAERLTRAGVELERRLFHPHLTLARWRTSRPSDARRVLATDRRTPIARIAVDHVTLYHSHLSAAGPLYSVLARATLT
jgi:2'-5' RNA ligase